MVIRLQGIVRAARRVQQRLGEGIEPAAREAFLLSVREEVRTIEAFCDEAGGTPRDLPTPSRRAFEVLRDAAALDSGGLPGPRAGAAPRGTLTVTNVEATLRRCLAWLAAEADDAQARQRVRDRAQACVASVRRICEAQGVTPAALTDRTGPAFALLAWLADGVHVDRAADRVLCARGAFEAAVRKQWPAIDPVARVTFRPGKTLYAVRRRGRLFEWKLSVGYLAACEQDFIDLAQAAGMANASDDGAWRRSRTFQASEAFGAMEEEIRAFWRGTADRPRGHAYDLDRLYRRLNERYFGGALERPRLAWRPSLSSGCFGTYVSATNLVVIDARLDDPAVPEFVAECVLYHELLHKKHGIRHAGRRGHAHTPAFRADERRHPHLEACERWLVDLARHRP